MRLARLYLQLSSAVALGYACGGGDDIGQSRPDAPPDAAVVAPGGGGRGGVGAVGAQTGGASTSGGVSTSDAATIRDASVLPDAGRTSDAGSLDAGSRDARIDPLDASSDTAGTDGEAPDALVDAAAPGISCRVADAAANDASADDGAFFVEAAFDQPLEVAGTTLVPLETLYGNTYLVRVDAGGTPTWAVGITSTVGVLPGPVATRRASDAVFVTVVARAYEAQGDVTFGSTDGNAITRSTKSAPDGTGEAFVARYSLDGKVEWVRRFGPADGTAEMRAGGAFSVSALEERRGRLTVVGVKTGFGNFTDVDVLWGDDGTGSGVAGTYPIQLGFVWSLELDAGTGAPDASTFRRAGADTGSKLYASTSIRLHSENGDCAFGGHNVFTRQLTYYMGYGTADALEIAPGAMLEDAWVGKIRPSLSHASLWAYRIGSPGIDAGTTTAMLQRGEVLVSGGGDGDFVDLFHAGGSRRVDLSGSAVGWIGKYASDGSDVPWAHASDSGVKILLATDAEDAAYVRGTGSRTIHVAIGTSSEHVLELGSPSLYSSYLARLSIATGRVHWASPILSPKVVDIYALDLVGCELIAYVVFERSATFDPGGPGETIFTVDGGGGEAVHGIARFSFDGRFIDFSEAFRHAPVDNNHLGVRARALDRDSGLAVNDK